MLHKRVEMGEARFVVEVFAGACFRAMELFMILGRCLSGVKYFSGKRQLFFLAALKSSRGTGGSPRPRAPVP
jgi:hypothetical protein